METTKNIRSIKKCNAIGSHCYQSMLVTREWGAGNVPVSVSIGSWELACTGAPQRKQFSIEALPEKRGVRSTDGGPNQRMFGEMQLSINLFV